METFFLSLDLDNSYHNNFDFKYEKSSTITPRARRVISLEMNNQR